MEASSLELITVARAVAREPSGVSRLWIAAAMFYGVLGGVVGGVTVLLAWFATWMHLRPTWAMQLGHMAPQEALLFLVAVEALLVLWLVLGLLPAIFLGAWVGGAISVISASLSGALARVLPTAGAGCWRRAARTLIDASIAGTVSCAVLAMLSEPAEGTGRVLFVVLPSTAWAALTWMLAWKISGGDVPRAPAWVRQLAESDEFALARPLRIAVRSGAVRARQIPSWRPSHVRLETRRRLLTGAMWGALAFAAWDIVAATVLVALTRFWTATTALAQGAAFGAFAAFCSWRRRAIAGGSVRTQVP
jgi:hypothetical protein